MTLRNIDIPINFRIKSVGYKLFTSKTVPTTVRLHRGLAVRTRAGSSLQNILIVDFLQINILFNTRLSNMFTIVLSEQLRKSIRFKR